jgi:hypothetical protein
VATADTIVMEAIMVVTVDVVKAVVVTVVEVAVN